MQRKLASLSERERQLLSLAAIGFTDKAISQELSVSVHTLRTYWDRIRNKLGGLSRPALVAAYVSNQVVGRELSFFETLGLNGWVMEAKTSLVSASDGVNAKHSLQTGIQHHQREYEQIVHPDDVKEYLIQVARVQRGDTTAVHVVCRNVLQTGIETLHTTMIGVKDADGAVDRVYGTNTEFQDSRPDGRPNVRMGRFHQRFPQGDLQIDSTLASILGIEGQETLGIAQLAGYLGTEGTDRMVTPLDASLDFPPDSLEADLKVRLPDGKTIWARTWRRVVQNEDGTDDIYGFLAIPE